MHLCTHDRLRAASVEELETEDWFKYLVQRYSEGRVGPGNFAPSLSQIRT
jgi:hypothetical protein